MKLLLAVSFFTRLAGLLLEFPSENFGCPVRLVRWLAAPPSVFNRAAAPAAIACFISTKHMLPNIFGK